jgi:MoaA/NifB/PqqE/SkfB family radical SAM enzyme
MFGNTELAIMPTYRCNARCQICHIWKYPSRREEELTLEDIARLPEGFCRINLGGGEPTLREDIVDIVDILSTKSDHVEISTNGSLTQRLVEVVKRHPDIRVRVSLDGLPRKNDEIRGIRNGFDRAMRTVLRLKNLGAKDVGFAITISHRNSRELVDLYHLCAHMGVEFSQSVVHDAWQFRVPNNVIENQEEVEDEIRRFIRELLQSKRKDYFLRVKDWYRAYLNRGFINFVRGDQRLLPCGAGTDIVFIDPYGEIYPCNALPESMGNVRESSFEECWESPRAQRVREMVSECTRNCWMVGTSRPAIRHNPRKPTAWVLKNKIRLLLGKDIIWDVENGDGSGDGRGIELGRGTQRRIIPLGEEKCVTSSPEEPASSEAT